MEKFHNGRMLVASIIHVRTIIIIVMFLISGCQKQQKICNSDMRTYLTGGRVKYWTPVWELPLRRNEGVAIFSNGDYITYYNPISFSETTRFILRKYSWTLSTDSVLTLGDFRIKIEYVNEDVLITNSLNSRSVVVFTASPDQFTIPIADTSKSVTGFPLM